MKIKTVELPHRTSSSAVRHLFRVIVISNNRQSYTNGRIGSFELHILRAFRSRNDRPENEARLYPDYRSSCADCNEIRLLAFIWKSLYIKTLFKIRNRISLIRRLTRLKPRATAGTRISSIVLAGPAKTIHEILVTSRRGY